MASRSSMCKTHHREYVRNHYQNNKKYYVEKAKRQKTTNGDFLRNAKSVPCADCGQRYPYYVMDFDHREGKEFNLSQYRTMGRKQIETEIAKCDVVCSNCHRKRTAKRAGYEVEPV